MLQAGNQRISLRRSRIGRRGFAEAAKLLLECRVEYGKRARRTPRRVQAPRVTMSPEESKMSIPGRTLTLIWREAKRRKTHRLRVRKDD
jgi:hypothetical protein